MIFRLTLAIGNNEQSALVGIVALIAASGIALVTAWRMWRPADAIFIRNRIGLDSTGFEAADINDDGVVDTDDFETVIDLLESDQ